MSTHLEEAETKALSNELAISRAKTWLGIEEVLELIDELDGYGLVWTDTDELRNRLQDLDFKPGNGATD